MEFPTLALALDASCPIRRTPRAERSSLASLLLLVLSLLRFSGQEEVERSHHLSPSHPTPDIHLYRVLLTHDHRGGAQRATRWEEGMTQERTAWKVEGAEEPPPSPRNHFVLPSLVWCVAAPNQGRGRWRTFSSHAKAFQLIRQSDWYHHEPFGGGQKWQNFLEIDCSRRDPS